MSSYLTFYNPRQRRVILEVMANVVSSSSTSGASITSNSVDSTHIIDGSVLGTDISNGTISQAKFDAAFVAVIQDISNRIMALEQTALIRSFDTIVAPVSNFTIPVDLSENEGIQIDLNILVGGNSGASGVFCKYNTAGGTNLGWPNYCGEFSYGDSGTTSVIAGGSGTGGSNGLISNSPNSGESINVRVELFRSFDVNTPSQRYYMRTRSLSFFVGSTYGIARVDSIGAVSNAVITGLYFSVSAGTTLKASYSIIKDTRRTSFNGAFL